MVRKDCRDGAQGGGGGIGREVVLCRPQETAALAVGALDHQTGRILAYVVGRREDRALRQLKALLTPFGIRRFYTDGWSASHRHWTPHHHVVGKRRTQQLERKHLTLRTRIKRLVRKTIGFSRSVHLHDIVIGLFINRFEFGLAV